MEKTILPPTIGSVLLLLGVILSYPSQHTHAQCPNSSRDGIHVVQQGENLYRISLKYGVSLAEVCTWNDMGMDETLPMCKELIVKPVLPDGEQPRGEGAAYSPQSGNRHVVKRGESLSGLAELYGYTEQRFRDMNHLKSGEGIAEGTVLVTDHCSNEPPPPPSPEKPSVPAIKPPAPKTEDSPPPSPPSPPPAPSAPASRPAPAAPYMNQSEWAMISEINLLRANPSSYAEYVRDFKASGLTRAYGLLDGDADQAITKLKMMQPLPRLQPKECVYDAAKEHGEFIHKHGNDNDYRAWEWVKKSCPEFQDGGECVATGQTDIRHAVIALLIDQPAARQANRQMLLNPYWTHMASYRTPGSWVQKFAQEGPSAVDHNQLKLPAPAAPYMNQYEWAMIDEVNLLRSNPSGYVKYVREYEKSHRAEMLGLNKATVEELVAELGKTPRLSTLQPSECLYGTVKKHGRDLIDLQELGHTGKDGSWPWHRIEKACGWAGGNENIVGGADEIRHAVMALLIDEGITTRGHRRNLLNPDWTHMACFYMGTVGEAPYAWVQNFMTEGKKSTRVNSPENGVRHTGIGTPRPPVPPVSQPTQPHHDSKDESEKGGASPAPYMSDLEWAMVEEINLLRRNPTGYVKILEDYLDKEGAQWGISQTVADELVAELRNTPSLSTLQPSECVYQAASLHGEDLRKRGASGHRGSNGSWPWERVRDACTGWMDGNENIVSGHADARGAVITLLIDDGITTRGHRRTLLNPKWTHIACRHIGKVGNMPHLWIQQFGQR